MENYLKVESDTSLVRDVNTNAIINQNKSENKYKNRASPVRDPHSHKDFLLGVPKSQYLKI